MDENVSPNVEPLNAISGMKKDARCARSQSAMSIGETT